MNKSRWSYVFVGISGLAALFGAAMHSVAFTIINAALIVFNWYSAEAQRKLEDEILLLEYQIKLKEENLKE